MAVEQYLMSHRTIPAILIVALLACPFRCSAGACCIAENCLEEQCLDEDPSQPSEQEPTCCSHCEKNHSDSERDEFPSRCPDESSCQGVCGGAVIEKAPVVDLQNGVHFVPLTINETVFLAFVAIPWARQSEVRSNFDGNVGRFLRTLHESLIC